MKRTLAIGGIVWLLFALHLCSAQTAVMEKDYLVANYTTEDGLPANSVHGIEQTPDGYIWLATYNGLARFDGVKFTVFNKSNTPELSASSLAQLHADQVGRLWIVDESLRVAMWDGERFHRISGGELPDAPISIEGEFREGRLLVRVIGPNNYLLYDGSRFRDWSWGEEGDSDQVYVDRRGRMWMPKQGVWYPGYSKKVLENADARRDVWRDARPSRRPGFWLACMNGLAHYTDSKFDFEYPSPEKIGDITAMLEDADGNVWIGTWSQGLWRVDKTGKFLRYPVTPGARPEAVRALLEDSEGNIWVGAEGSGLFRLRRKIFETLDVRSGLSAEVIRSVTRDSHDNVWVMNQIGIDRIEARNGDKITHVRDFDVGWAVYADNADRIWIGSFGGELHSIEGGVEKRFLPNVTNKVPAINAFLEYNHTLLVGTMNGLWEVRDGQLQQRDTGSIPHPQVVRAFARGKGGELFVGFGGSGLWKLKEGNWSRVAPQSFNEEEVRALHCDTNGTLWVATYERGLHRIVGEESFHFESHNLNLPRQIASITEDATGRLWLASLQGIVSISREDLNHYADGETDILTPIRYSKTDGLHTVEASVGHQPLACATSDGRLWFGTVKGLSVVNPKRIARNTTPPLVVIEEAQYFLRNSSAPQIVQRPKGAVPIKIPPGAQRLELSYTALNFAAPERVRFRFRLDGQDWTEAGARRTAYFQGLAPGDYTFRVLACNNDGVWNNNAAMATFTIMPRFFETTWFRGLVGVVIAGWVWIVIRARLARLRAVNDLRLRIARDLHDEIGANLGSIGLNTELLMNDTHTNDDQRKDLAEIRGVAAQTAQSVRDIVWFTNPNFDNTTGMLRRMREVATLLLAGRKWSFDVSDDPAAPLPLEFRRNVFSIFKEALHNTVKHSNATEVKIQIAFEKDRMKMLIADNGCGFDAAAVSRNGLINLRRRAEEIDGDLDVSSAVGRGTRVEFAAPIKPKRWFKNWFPRTRD